jgi:hypothetical protein
MELLKKVVENDDDQDVRELATKRLQELESA